MALTIQLSPAAEQKLLERATHHGQTLEGYVQALLERAAQSPVAGQEIQGNHLTSKLREWLYQQVNEEETVADLQELREKGGLELQDFLPDLEQVVHDRERTSR